HRLQKRLLHRQIFVGVVAAGAADQQAADHGLAYLSTGLRAAPTSSSRPTGVAVGAAWRAWASVWARSHSSRNTRQASSRVSLLSVSVGSTMRASWTMRGKYMVGGWMPWSSKPLAMSMADTPVSP